MTKAGDVALGACLMTVDGEEKVVGKEIVESFGIYTLVTNEALVVVNGVVASPFAGRVISRNVIKDTDSFFFILGCWGIIDLCEWHSCCAI